MEYRAAEEYPLSYAGCKVTVKGHSIVDGIQLEIEEAIATGLRLLEAEGKETWEKGYEDGRFHVSDATACRRAVQNRRRKAPITNVQPVESTLVKEVGKVYHEVLQRALEKAGVVVRADWKDDPFTIVDGDARGHPDLLVLLDSGRGLEVWDIKSKPSWKFRGDKAPDAQDDEILQIHGYMGPMNVKEGGFIFVNRDNGRYYPVRIQFDPNKYHEFQQEINKRKMDDGREVLPERLEPEHWKCRYFMKDKTEVPCVFFSACWPDVETKTRVA